MPKNKDWKAAAFFLASLDITRLLKEPVQNTLYRYLVVSSITGQKLFVENYSWSGSPSSDGDLVYFGGADAVGAGVVRGGPGVSYSFLCAVVSRSGF